MQKIICDVCGKEIVKPADRVTLRYTAFDHDDQTLSDRWYDMHTKHLGNVIASMNNHVDNAGETTMLNQLFKRQTRRPQAQTPDLSNPSAFIQRWSGARRLLNAGQVLEVNAARGIYRVGDVDVNLSAGTCACCAPSKSRGFRPACEHLNAAFLFADAAQTAVEDVEELLDLEA